MNYCTVTSLVLKRVSQFVQTLIVANLVVHDLNQYMRLIMILTS